MARKTRRSRGKNNKGNLKYQFKMKLRSLNRIGQSKHEAKQEEKMRCQITGEKWNPAKVEGIYSLKTMESYKENIYKFTEWEKSAHPEVNDCENISKDHVGEWLQQSIDRGNSAWTVRLQAAAMAKVLDCSSKDFGVALPKRERKDITRSRGDRAHDREINLEKHKDLVEFCKGTGLRRREVTLLKPSRIFQEKDRIFVEVAKTEGGGKGGKPRTLQVVREYRVHVLECRDKAIQDEKERVFDEVPNKLDIHSYRREYCQERYQEIAEHREQERCGREVTKKEKYYTRDGTHRVFDKGALQELTVEMGHERTDVMVSNYLR